MTIIERNEDIWIEMIETSPFGTNTYIVTCMKTNHCVVVDAPGDVSSIMEAISDTTPTCILLTHGHVDHTVALRELHSALNVPVAAHEADAGTLPVTCDMLLKDGGIVSFGRIALEALHTPGHTPGSLCYLTDGYLIAGDTVFPGGPGKTSTPDAFKQIVKSIAEKIFVLPDDTLVLPGHGSSTILKKEKDKYAVFSSRSHRNDLCGDVLWLSS